MEMSTSDLFPLNMKEAEKQVDSLTFMLSCNSTTTLTTATSGEKTMQPSGLQQFVHAEKVEVSITGQDICSKKTGDVTNYVVLDSISEIFDIAILGIKQSKVIGLSMEGISQGRQGKLVWLQISVDGYAFLFDMIALDTEGFTQELRDIIEDCNILKVVHDCRAMSDYLHHCCGIQLANVFDTQVADLMVFKQRNRGHLPCRANSLLVCLMEHLDLPTKLFSAPYLKLLMEDSVEAWSMRPAEEVVLEAIAFRVSYLSKLRLRLMEKMLSQFTDGCDIYLGLMRDSRSYRIPRLQNQLHLVPFEFYNLSWNAAISRQRLEVLQKRIFGFSSASASVYQDAEGIYNLDDDGTGLFTDAPGSSSDECLENGGDESLVLNMEYDLPTHEVNHNFEEEYAANNLSTKDNDCLQLQGDDEVFVRQSRSESFAADLEKHDILPKCVKDDWPSPVLNEESGSIELIDFSVKDTKSCSEMSVISLSEIVREQSGATAPGNNDEMMMPAGNEKVWRKRWNNFPSRNMRHGTRMRWSHPRQRNRFNSWNNCEVFSETFDGTCCSTDHSEGLAVLCTGSTEPKHKGDICQIITDAENNNNKKEGGHNNVTSETKQQPITTMIGHFDFQTVPAPSRNHANLKLISLGPRKSRPLKSQMKLNKESTRILSLMTEVGVTFRAQNSGFCQHETVGHEPEAAGRGRALAKAVEFMKLNGSPK